MNTEEKSRSVITFVGKLIRSFIALKDGGISAFTTYAVILSVLFAAQLLQLWIMWSRFLAAATK